MKLKQKIIIACSAILMAVSVASLSPALASAAKCGDVQVSVLPTSVCDKNKNGGNAVTGILVLVVNILTAGVGIAAVGGLVWAAILYTTAEDKPSQVSQAKTIIVNVVIGIVAFGLMFAALNFIVPGGVFN